MDLTNPFRKKPATLAKLPRVMRVYIAGCIAGFGLSAVFTATLIGMNVANLGHLVFNVSGGWLAALMLFVFNGIVFAGVQTGVVIMSMPYPGQEGDGGRGDDVTAREPIALPIPVNEGR